MNCAEMTNEYDGVHHNYTKKQGLVWQRVFLPPMAPAAWLDREILWNAVEEAEKTKESRLAREFVVALPVELNRDDWIALLTDFIQTQFVNEGMCADVAIHDTDGHNPHAHIMLTVRPLNADGSWQHKTEKEYLCVRDGEERGFTAAEYKDAQNEGWEKQFPYWITKKKKEYMTPSEAEAHGYERASRYAKNTRYGRQNPISAQWNSEEQLVLWRAAWADAVNAVLERKGLDERIDHRSHAERGLDEQPTIHEGVAARTMEAKGLISDRCELNRQIKADNLLLCILREAVERLTAAMENTVAGIAAALEAARERIIVSTYGIRHTMNRLSRMKPSIDQRIALKQEYDELRKAIRTKVIERKKLQKEKKALNPVHVKRHLELASAIAGLTEEMEELRSQKGHILVRARCEDDADMKIFAEKLDQAKQNYNDLIERKTALTAERQDGITMYEDAYERIPKKNASASELNAKADFRKPFPKSTATASIRQSWPTPRSRLTTILLWTAGRWSIGRTFMSSNATIYRNVETIGTAMLGEPVSDILIVFLPRCPSQAEPDWL